MSRRSLGRRNATRWVPETHHVWQVLVIPTAALALSAAACGPSEKSEVAPGVRCLNCEGYNAVTPGAELELWLEWTAWCRYDGVGDTSSTEMCDEQPFIATIECNGAACELEDDAFATGVELDGFESTVVSVTGEGDLTLDVELVHAQSGETYRRAYDVVVREPDEIVIDCTYDSDPQRRNCIQQDGYLECEVSWVPCAPDGIFESEGGNPLSIWVYGMSDAGAVWLVDRPIVRFDGFEATEEYETSWRGHTEDAIVEAERFEAVVTQAGGYRVTATFGDEVSVLDFSLE